MTIKYIQDKFLVKVNILSEENLILYKLLILSRRIINRYTVCLYPLYRELFISFNYSLEC